MFQKYLQGSTVYLDETEGDGSDAGGGDRGDGLEGKDDEDLEVEEGEEEEGVEKTAAEKAEAEKKEKEEKDKKSKMVPHERMKEAVKKERAAREAVEKRATEAEDKLKESQRGVDLDKLADEIEALDEKLDKALVDNDLEAKKAIRRQIRDKQMTLARAEAAALSAQATALAVERVRYDALVERLEVSHPEMNPDHDDYSEESVAEVVELKEAYEAKGISSSEALKKAVKYVFKGTEKKADESEEVDEEAQKKAEEDLRAKAVRKAQAAKRDQPASTDKGGKPSDKSGGALSKNINKLSDAEFEKLDEKEVARLRGDEV